VQTIPQSRAPLKCPLQIRRRQMSEPLTQYSASLDDTSCRVSAKLFTPRTLQRQTDRWLGVCVTTVRPHERSTYTPASAVGAIPRPTCDRHRRVCTAARSRSVVRHQPDGNPNQLELRLLRHEPWRSILLVDTVAHVSDTLVIRGYGSAHIEPAIRPDRRSAPSAGRDARFAGQRRCYRSIRDALHRVTDDSTRVECGRVLADDDRDLGFRGVFRLILCGSSYRRSPGRRCNPRASGRDRARAFSRTPQKVARAAFSRKKRQKAQKFFALLLLFSGDAFLRRSLAPHLNKSRRSCRIDRPSAIGAGMDWLGATARELRAAPERLLRFPDHFRGTRRTGRCRVVALCDLS
jgi:hypothetical protein